MGNDLGKSVVIELATAAKVQSTQHSLSAYGCQNMRCLKDFTNGWWDSSQAGAGETAREVKDKRVGKDIEKWEPLGWYG